MTIGPTFRIHPAQGVAHLTWGVLTNFELWRTLLNDVTRDPRFERGYSILEDLRQLRTPAKTVLREWPQIVEEFAPRVRPCRWAVVLPPVTLSAFDQVRAAADRLRRDEVDLCVFLDFRAAEYWARRSEGVRRVNPDQPE